MLEARTLLVLLCVAVGAAACGDREVKTADGGGAGSDVIAPAPDQGPPFVGGKDVDILLVMDNSGSMGEEQIQLVSAIGQFNGLISRLRDPRFGDDGTGKPCSASTSQGCALPNLHVGIVSTDLGAGSYGLPSCERTGGDEGKLQADARVAGCARPADAYVAYIDGKTNIPGAGSDSVQAVSEGLTCIGRLGTGGCGFEQPLESARRALQPGRNPGFLRPGAALAIIIISDEDDCSARNTALFDPTQQALSDPLGPLTSFRCFEFGVECDINDRSKIGPRQNCAPSQDWLYSVESYVTFFKGLKPPGGVIVAAISGPAERVEVGKDGPNPVLMPSCTSAAGAAVPAIRLRAFTDAFGADGIFSSICLANYGPAMAAVAERVLTKLAP